MTDLLDAPAITGPGVYDIPEDAYHADPVPGGSLSSSGARKLLACPARYRWEQEHPPAPKKEFDLGTAAHRLVLGTGPKLVRIDATEWRTNAVKDEVAAVRAAGAIPLKPAEWDQVHAMAAAIHDHPYAGTLFDPWYGAPERTLIWEDDETGVWRRARLDFLPDPACGRPIIADLKTTRSADLHSIQKSIATYGYHCQDAWYRDAVEALVSTDDDVTFVFVFQEKEPPYLVTVVELDDEAVQAGRDANRRALRLYREYTDTARWPGYSDDVTRISLPRWAAATYTEEIL